MRKITLVLAIIVFSLFVQMLRAQDFSNKGKEFWFCFPNHIPSGNNLGRMSIWITSDLASSGTITMTNGTFNTVFSVAANGITQVDIPYNLAHISNAESHLVIQKSLKISVNPGQPAIVAYAQQYGAARSAATLLLPTSVLGKKYRAASYTYNNTSSGGQNSRSQFQVIATKPNTEVRITPYANGVAAAPFNVLLPNAGDMYQYQATADVTASLIETIASANGACVPVAVFSGSSAASFGISNCSTGQLSYDPLFQQLYPITTWGKNYGFVPFGDYANGNPFRIIAAEDNTNVSINGTYITTLNAGNIYPNTFDVNPIAIETPSLISADKPISVIQYAQRRDCSGTGNGDPDMVILNPIEQNIQDITVFASTQQNIDRQWLNVLIKENVAGSFRINGLPPTTAFQAAPNIPGFSYLQHRFNPATQGSYRLSADSGFNAIVYGFQGGNYESYAYSAGTNVRDLSQQVGFSFPNALEVSSTGCKGSEFKYKVAFPATLNVTQMVWDFMGAPMLPNNTTVNVSSPTIDSSTVVNGKLLNWFSLPTLYTYTTAGNYFLKITITISNADNCGNEQEYEFPITITDPPVATFSFPPIQCVGETIQFTETTPQTPKPTYKFWWSFDDAVTGANNNSTLRNPTHLFSAPGNYTVRFHNITTPGCLSDTTDQQITVPDFPRASIASDVPTVCMDGASPRITFTGTDGIPEYEFSYTIDNGTGPGPVQTITSTGGTASLNVPTNVAGTFRYNLISVKNVGSSICTRSYNNVFAEVVVNANTGLALTTGSPNQTVCQNTAITDIVYTISGGGTNATIIGPALPTGLTGMYNNATKTYTISGTPTGAPGTYPFTVEATGPCLPNTLTGAITINELPSAAISNSAAEVCLNAPSPTVTLTGSGGTAPYTFTYRLNGTLQPAVTSSGNTYIINVPTNVTGTFLYELVNITDASSTACAQAQSGSATVIVNPLPTASFTTLAPYCTTRPISFTNTSVPNAGNITTWVWNFGDASAPVTINAPANPNAQHIFTTANTYNVTLTATTDKGCVSTNPAVPITITNRPKPGFIIPEVCINDVASIFTDTSRVDGGETFDAAGYLWTFGDPGSGAANTATTMHGSHLYTAIGPYNVMHAVTTTAGCKDTAYGTIFINAADPVSDFNIVTPTTLCANDTVSLVNRSTISQGSVTKLEIYWDALGAPTTFETVDVPVFNGVYKHKYPTLTTTQTYRIRMVAYSGSICLADKFDNITVNAAPRVQFLAMNNVCFDAAPFQITQASELGGVVGTPTYSGPGVSSSGIFNPSLVVPGIPHAIQYLYTSSTAGCKDSATQTITVWDTAAAKISLAPITCEKNAISFSSNNSTLPAAAGTITGYSWNFGDPISGGNNSAITASPNHTFNGWGNYTVTLQVTTSNNCRSTVASLPLTVHSLPRPNFTIPITACLPSATIQFNVIAPTMPDGTVPAAYLWNFDDPASGVNNTAASSSPTHIYESVGPFNVNLQVTSINGCVHDSSIVINTIHPQPIADFSIDKTEVCVGGSFQFTDNTNFMDGTAVSWNWTLKDGNARTTNAFTYTYTQAQTYAVELFAVNSHGCRSTTAIKPITVHPFPVVDAGPDRLMLEGGQITLEPVVTGNDLSYVWTPNRYISGSNTIKNLVVNGIDDIRYLLTVTARGNCSDTSSVFIKVLKAPSIPNIFSPNGDGVHDKWVIDYLDTYPGSTVEIFNRYGQMIFRSVGYSTPWDGTINGKPVPVGTYYYIVDPKNGRKLMTGYVDVIR